MVQPQVSGELKKKEEEEKYHTPSCLFVYRFPDSVSHMWDILKAYSVNDNNPPGLSISTLSLWPAKRRGRWSVEDCGFCSSEQLK